VQYFRDHQCPKTNFLFLVEYTIPLNIPVSKRKDFGKLEGSLFDFYSKIPIPKATMSCKGNRVMTDDLGCFAFPFLSSGDHFVKTEILPNDLISVNSMGEKINIIGGKNNKIKIPVVTSCTIEGDLFHYGFEDTIESLKKIILEGTQPQLQEIGGIRGMRIIINKDDEIFTTVTNTAGHFSFRKLRPGQWHIRIETENLPELHYLDMNNLIIDVKPGEQRKIVFKVIPQERHVQALE